MRRAGKDYEDKAMSSRRDKPEPADADAGPAPAGEAQHAPRTPAGPPVDAGRPSERELAENAAEGKPRPSEREAAEAAAEAAAQQQDDAEDARP
jgi:hypothetical protein